MVYAYNLPNLGYGYDQYYYYSSSSYSSQNHHHVGPGFDALLRGDASTPHLGGAHHRSSSMPKDPFGNVDLSSHVVAALNATGHTQRYDVNHDTMFQTPNSQCFVKPIEETPVGAMASECLRGHIVLIFLSSSSRKSRVYYAVRALTARNAPFFSSSSFNSYVHLHLGRRHRRDTAIHQVDHLRQRRWFVNVQFSSVERIVLERVVERVHITFRSD